MGEFSAWDNFYLEFKVSFIRSERICFENENTGGNILEERCL